MENENSLKEGNLDDSKGSGVFSEERWAQIARALGFSKRELQLTQAVFDNATDLAIAADLGLSHHTVHAHFKRLYRRLGIGTRGSLIVRVVQTNKALHSAQGTL